MDNCPGTCEEQKQACVPFFVAEAQAMHYDSVIRRFLAAIVSVCITVVLLVSIFVAAYNVREKDRIDTIARLVSVLEVQYGLHEQPDS
jgi:flagellar biosynthesis protein FliQ